MGDNKGLLFIVPLTIFIGIILDIDRGVTISYTDSFIGFLNVLVMGVLTYYIYKVNDRAAVTNDKIAEITALQVYSAEKRMYSKIIFKIRKYTDSANVLKFMTYPNLSTYMKCTMVKEALAEDTTINKHSLTFAFPELAGNLPHLELGIDFKQQNGKLEGKELEDVSKINDLFYNAMPNSVHAYWQLKDAIDALSP